MTRRASVIGVGMIGGSIASGLRRRGWHVTGSDLDPSRADEAVRRGILDEAGVDPAAEITFVATPVSTIADAAEKALAGGGVVTDAGSVKGPVAATVQARKFVPGHPMAGSEKDGLDGADADLFVGATWVLTPTAHTDPEAYLVVRNVVTELGADVVTLDADEHDEMVATISHVPHVAAAALMTVAVERARKHDAVLRLAAGGFRDMTRIAAGRPDLWADIALENRDAIVEGLGRLTAGLDEITELLASGNRSALEKWLAGASHARKELPLRQGRPAELVSLAVVIPDAPGALARVFDVFGDLRVNVEDVDINHAIEGGKGTLLLTVAADAGERAAAALAAGGFKVTAEAL